MLAYLYQGCTNTRRTKFCTTALIIFITIIVGLNFPHAQKCVSLRKYRADSVTVSEVHRSLQNWAQCGHCFWRLESGDGSYIFWGAGGICGHLLYMIIGGGVKYWRRQR